MKRASYRDGVNWIAELDEPCETDPTEVAGFISTLLLADLFGVDPARVAVDVVRARARIDRLRGEVQALARLAPNRGGSGN